MRGFRDLKVYKMSFDTAIQIFEYTKSFPIEERYSLTDQIRRSSRSVSANIAEGYRKRQYPNMFVNKMSDADAEATETQVWLDFAFHCKYISKEVYNDLTGKYEEIGKMLGSMIASPEKFKV